MIAFAESAPMLQIDVIFSDADCERLFGAYIKRYIIVRLDFRYRGGTKFQALLSCSESAPGLSRCRARFRCRKHPFSLLDNPLCPTQPLRLIHLRQVYHDAVLDPVPEHAQVPADLHQCRPLIAELDADPPTVARPFAAAPDKVLDRYLLQRCRLIPGEVRQIDIGVAI